MKHYAKKIHALGASYYLNPDGHEWLRSKWSKPVRAYWKLSEKGMVKSADYIICDSKNIESYIQDTYAKYKPATTFIAYGAEVDETGDDDRLRQGASRQTLLEEKANAIDAAESPSDITRVSRAQQLLDWLTERDLKAGEYYLVVGRFVPENNYETILREFMLSLTKKKLVIITTENAKFAKALEEKLGYQKDSRICFAGTVYDEELLKGIRRNAYGYFHGHEVGGTNPSLLEALGSTQLTMAVDVGFNREVIQEAGIFWKKDFGNLSMAIDKADRLTPEQLYAYALVAKERIAKEYSWEKIKNDYEAAFLRQ